MHILNSPWLIHMLAKSSKTPRGRLLGLFDILQDWLDAPHIGEQFKTGLQAQAPEKDLMDFLTREATKAGAVMPEMLASQLYFMAIVATQEKLHTNHPLSLSHAKSAASALIAAQTKTEFRITKPAAYAVAASFAAICAMAGSLLIFNLQQPVRIHAAAQPPRQVENLHSSLTETAANPQQTAALINQIEQMRQGSCQLIEAIQLPDSQKGIYLNMMVNGQVSTDPQEQAIALDLLRRTRCNYTPMLMANSTG